MIRSSVFSLAAAVCLLAAASLPAAPALRLRIPAETERPIWIPIGTNGPIDIVFHVFNQGDGVLDVQVRGDVPWLAPRVEGPAPCPFDVSLTCRRVRVLFQTAALAAGTRGGAVMVSTPGAVDAPQTTPIKIYVGGNVPDRVDFFVPPLAGASESLDFQTPAGDAPQLSAAGGFLSVTSSGLGSFRYVHTHRIVAGFRPGMAVGDNPGSVTLAGSNFAPDNRTFPVVLHVTNDPIARLSSTVFSISTARELAPPDQALVVANRGGGALAVSGIDVSTESGGAWLSVEDAGNNVFLVKTDVTGLAAGSYIGALTVNSNAANSPLSAAVLLLVAEPGGPIASFRGAVNGATFNGLRPVAPGTIVSVFGSLLSFTTAQASDVPLPTELGGTKVLIDGVEAPLFFVSFGQINFQMPYNVLPGERLIQIFRDGQAGNLTSVRIDTRSAGIFRLNIAEYGAIRNATQGNFPLPVEIGVARGFPTAPARPGDVLEIFATGLGPVNPPVESGAAAGVPLSRAVDIPLVNFSRLSFGPKANPLFVGLTPGFVGLFQVNVIIPENAPTDARTRLTLEYPDGRRSNTVEIAVVR